MAQMSEQLNAHAVEVEPQPDNDFPTSLFAAIEHIRGAFTELFSSINADMAVPYALSRRLGVNRNLMWKIARIVTNDDPFSAVEHLPGPQGMEIVLGALANQGAPPRAIDDVRAVLAEFDRLVEKHAGNRRTLDLMLASHVAAPLEPAEETRRLAFEGNSAIWGLQARVRFASYFVAPAAGDDGMLDAATLSGLIDVRRLRSRVSLPVFQMGAYDDDGTPRGDPRDPLDGAGSSDRSMLLPAFCSDGAPPLQPVLRAGSMHFELPPGPVGRTALASWVYGWRAPRLASAYRDEVNQFGEHGTSIGVPVEVLLCDLHVHRSLPWAQPVQRVLYSELAGPYMGAAQPCDELPVREPLASLGGWPPVVATPLLPRYTEWVRWTFDQLRWEARDFVAFRFVMKYPPIPSVLVLRHPLAQPPASAGVAGGSRASQR
jgi:hypothetical protein